ncbi:sugar phosphate nucleotidyltransferase [Desulfosporosinus sp. Sb-LF]|uniref:sugar phosphate nucleotidyltransferase n=1 Tax=Desulfosporosinus sp. Sb-LF TaxID=2560027 RepID=UPI00107F01C1|nr:sugar phosphate nucleotidyltransferase [Desulfosporosinus sp. Sb-LF]TGE31910.1 cupin domain-containing protein [Desulfosporosinus sp. Sb-LF]
MKLILLSGGSGKRLWPLSNDARSKQFLKVLESSNGESESMVQRVWGQLRTVGLADSAVVATSKSQVDMLQSQLGDSVKMVVEPERRDTYPAIALAAAYLSSVERVDPNEVVAVLPVDSFVDDRFFQQVKELENVLITTEADLALVGVTPTYPSEKYGYIVPESKQDGLSFLKVSHFQEKPKEEQARELIAEQALWNCGVFAFKLGYILSKLEEIGLPTDYLALKNEYEMLPKISFDYEVVEKAKSVVAIRYDGEWKDLGTWNTLTEEIAAPIIGNGALCKESLGTHLINELDIPIIVLGLSNVVVAASPDGILVTNKKDSPQIKDLVNGIAQRPMFEERRWGWYRVLDYTKYENGHEVLTKRIGVSAGKSLSYQLHYLRSEVWTITNGEGEFALDDVIYEVKPGDVLHIPVGAKHGIRARTDLEFIEVQAGTDLVEGDIVRIFMGWDEVEMHCRTASEEVSEVNKSGLKIG